MDDDEVNCLMLHPVSWPNHGPLVELYLAEEAVGLVKSMDWELHKGPMWETTVNHGEESEEAEELVEGLRNEIDPPSFDIGENLALKKKENIQNGDYVYGPEV